MKTSGSRPAIESTVSAAFGLVMCLTAASAAGAAESRLRYEDADIKQIIADVSRLTGTSFLFDPTRVKGRITVIAPGEVTGEQALALLRSALALHGYAVVDRPDGTWIVPERDVTRPAFVVHVIRLTYADAVEVASTLAWIAPPGVAIVPHVPTNSVVLAGYDTDVEQMTDAIRTR